MDTILGKVAMACLLGYVAFSVISALRMYMVHSRYVHVEFAGRKWRTFGEWAPRQYRRLSLMRWFTILAIVVWVASMAWEIHKAS